LDVPDPFAAVREKSVEVPWPTRDPPPYAPPPPAGGHVLPEALTKVLLEDEGVSDDDGSDDDDDGGLADAMAKSEPFRPTRETMQPKIAALCTQYNVPLGSAILNTSGNVSDTLVLFRSAPRDTDGDNFHIAGGKFTRSLEALNNHLGTHQKSLNDFCLADAVPILKDEMLNKGNDGRARFGQFGTDWWRPIARNWLADLLRLLKPTTVVCMADIASALVIEVIESAKFIPGVFGTTQPKRDGVKWRSPGSEHPLKFEKAGVVYVFYAHPNAYSLLKGASPQTKSPQDNITMESYYKSFDPKQIPDDLNMVFVRKFFVNE